MKGGRDPVERLTGGGEGDEEFWRGSAELRAHFLRQCCTRLRRIARCETRGDLGLHEHAFSMSSLRRQSQPAMWEMAVSKCRARNEETARNEDAYAAAFAA